MKLLIGIVVLMALGVWLVVVQTTGPKTATVSNLPGPIASTPATAVASNEVPPLKGANSFTEAQAKTRIEAAGYTEVSGLLKDQDGIWRATAKKGGTSVQVALDFKGNVVSG